jgi:hypothetical protein
MVVVAIDIPDVSVGEVTFSHVLILLDLLALFVTEMRLEAAGRVLGQPWGTIDPSARAAAVRQHD